jgi:hypothetical protein
MSLAKEYNFRFILSILATLPKVDVKKHSSFSSHIVYLNNIFEDFIAEKLNIPINSIEVKIKSKTLLNIFKKAKNIEDLPIEVNEDYINKFFLLVGCIKTLRGENEQIFSLDNYKLHFNEYKPFLELVTFINNEKNISNHHLTQFRILSEHFWQSTEKIEYLNYLSAVICGQLILKEEKDMNFNEMHTGFGRKGSQFYEFLEHFLRIGKNIIKQDENYYFFVNLKYWSIKKSKDKNKHIEQIDNLVLIYDSIRKKNFASDETNELEYEISMVLLDKIKLFNEKYLGSFNFRLLKRPDTASKILSSLKPIINKYDLFTNLQVKTLNKEISEILTKS